MIVNRKHSFSQNLLIAYKVLGSRDEVVTKTGHGGLRCFYVLGRDKQSNDPDFYVKVLTVLTGASECACSSSLQRVFELFREVKEGFPEDRTDCRPSTK